MANYEKLRKKVESLERVIQIIGINSLGFRNEVSIKYFLEHIGTEVPANHYYNKEKGEFCTISNLEEEENPDIYIKSVDEIKNRIEAVRKLYSNRFVSEEEIIELLSGEHPEVVEKNIFDAEEAGISEDERTRRLHNMAKFEKAKTGIFSVGGRAYQNFVYNNITIKADKKLSELLNLTGKTQISFAEFKDGFSKIFDPFNVNNPFNANKKQLENQKNSKYIKNFNNALTKFENLIIKGIKDKYKVDFNYNDLKSAFNRSEDDWRKLSVSINNNNADISFSNTVRRVYTRLINESFIKKNTDYGKIIEKNENKNTLGFWKEFYSLPKYSPLSPFENSPRINQLFSEGKLGDNEKIEDIDSKFWNTKDNENGLSFLDLNKHSEDAFFDETRKEVLDETRKEEVPDETRKEEVFDETRSYIGENVLPSSLFTEVNESEETEDNLTIDQVDARSDIVEVDAVSDYMDEVKDPKKEEILTAMTDVGTLGSIKTEDDLTIDQVDARSDMVEFDSVSDYMDVDEEQECSELSNKTVVDTKINNNIMGKQYASFRDGEYNEKNSVVGINLNPSLSDTYIQDDIQDDFSVISHISLNIK